MAAWQSRRAPGNERRDAPTRGREKIMTITTDNRRPTGWHKRMVLAGDEFRWTYGHPSGRQTTRTCHAFGKPKKNSKTIEVYWQGRVIKLDRSDLTPTGHNVYSQNAPAIPPRP